jgi:hypothetical protein
MRKFGVGVVDNAATARAKSRKRITRHFETYLILSFRGMNGK